MSRPRRTVKGLEQPKGMRKDVDSKCSLCPSLPIPFYYLVNGSANHLANPGMSFQFWSQQVSVSPWPLSCLQPPLLCVLSGAQPLGVLLPPLMTTTAPAAYHSSYYSHHYCSSHCYNHYYLLLHRMCAPNITRSSCLHRKHFLLTELFLKTYIKSIDKSIPQ